MAYERLNLKNGTVVDEAHISHIEDGIVQNESDIANVSNSLADQLGSFTFKNVSVTTDNPDIKVSPYANNRCVILYSRRGLYIVYVTGGEASVVSTASGYEITAELDGRDLIIHPSYTTTFTCMVPYGATISAE